MAGSYVYTDSDSDSDSDSEEFPYGYSCTMYKFHIARFQIPILAAQYSTRIYESESEYVNKP